MGNVQEQSPAKVGRQMTKLINPDIWFGNLAITYANKLIGQRGAKNENLPNGNEPHYSMSGLSALLRGHGLKEFQTPYQDSDVASFSVVEVLTNKYHIKIWKGSLLLPFWKRKNPPLVTGNGTNIKPNVGEIILFHSTLIDCGGMSCQDKKNFVVRQKQFERINKKKS